MKRIAIIIISILLLSIPAYSQDSDTQKLSFEEKHQDKDYIILLREIEVILSEDYSYTTRTHDIIKIQKENGRDLERELFIIIGLRRILLMLRHFL